ncbi:hypothetical protein BKA82DRAFT_4349330 [Pisolithus tinctorius]|nr:hypothetical protein BKA82DRAFT_4349330 [Pisolithus tinctorius]
MTFKSLTRASSSSSRPGDLFLMLVDMKASLVKYELSNQTHQLQALQDTLSSKDFEDFIFEHLDVFKIPAGVFDDVELRGSLGRIVTKLLATIHSQLKSQLTISIAKKTCIINVSKNGVPGEYPKFIPEPERIPGSDANELDEMDSGFGLVSGKAARFNSNKFWNYVDYMLNLLHESVRKDAASKEDFEKTISSIFVQIFQDDLVDCPGNRRGAKILAVNPQWQMTIQQGLVW